jgi:thiosulfate dehydrogenase
MSEHQPDLRTWAAGIVFLGLAGFIGHMLPRSDTSNKVESLTAKLDKPVSNDAAENPKLAFSPPADDEIPDNEFGDAVRLGEKIFHDTQDNAREFVGNSLQCSNCHLDFGRLANAAPLWAAHVAYPAYRMKNDHVNTFEERLQGCFRYSMNGKAPASNDKVMVALESYAYFLAKGAPTGADLPGRGYPKLAKPAKLDYAHGQQVYAAKCALCHGADGQGQSAADGSVVFPPLWGPRSFNWGAGMSSITNAAGFIKANMPLSQGNTLTDAEAWDAASYMDSQERPQDPRFSGSVAETRKLQHDSPMDMYGQTVNGVVLGQNSPAAGPQP